MLALRDNNQSPTNLISSSSVALSKNEKQNRIDYVKRIIPATRVLPIIRIDSAESMDTHIETDKYEDIAKPEEAGGNI